jgi:hypothetical protein
MNAVRFASVAACLLCCVAGCATRLIPYQPGPVRIASVDYREAPGPPRESGDWKLLVSKDRLFTDDVLTVSVLLDAGALGKGSMLRVALARAAGEGEESAGGAPSGGGARAADEITLGDVRTTQIDIHVYFLGVPAGRYTVSAELSPPGGAPRRRLESVLTLTERP